MKHRIFEKGAVLNGPLVIVGVVLIIVVGVVVAVEPIKMYRMRQDTLKREALTSIQVSLEKFYDDFGRYPASTSDYLILDAKTKKGIPWGKIWPTYANPLPRDPNMSDTFIYVSSPRNDYQSYSLYGAFSYPEELGVVCAGEASCERAPVDVLCGAKICTGGVASPNVSP